MIWNKYETNKCQIEFGSHNIECIKMKLSDLYPQNEGVLFSNSEIKNRIIYLPKYSIDTSHAK